MSEAKNTFLESRPQSLCLMCGRCCRTVTAPISYDELKQLVNDGDEGAIDFLEIFEPYDSIEAARTSDERTVNNVLQAIQTDDILTKTDITFYKCKHLLENNLCGIYENRKELCDRFPSSPWAIIPPGCGFEKWLAEKREEKRQAIREQKENLIYAESLLTEAITEQQKERIQITIDNIRHTISLYAKYGANDW